MTPLFLLDDIYMFSDTVELSDDNHGGVRGGHGGHRQARAQRGTGEPP